MLVQVNTDHNIQGGEGLSKHVEATVTAALARFTDRLTRVEVHLSDVNGGKSHGDDKRCVMEARPAGMQPIAVTHLGATVDAAIDTACDKMGRLLESTFAKRDEIRTKPETTPGL